MAGLKHPLIIKFSIIVHSYPYICAVSNTGDQLKIVAAFDGTQATMFTRAANGIVTQEQVTINRGGTFTRDVVSGNTYRLVSDKKVFVGQVSWGFLLIKSSFSHLFYFLLPS